MVNDATKDLFLMVKENIKTKRRNMFPNKENTYLKSFSQKKWIKIHYKIKIEVTEFNLLKLKMKNLSLRKSKTPPPTTLKLLTKGHLCLQRFH